jgi:hypothetical protein
MQITSINSIPNLMMDIHSQTPKNNFVEYYNRLGKCYIKESINLEVEDKDNHSCSTFALYG